MAKKPYSNLKEIPAHIFRNRILTNPVGDEFKGYLRYMLDNHPEDLHYIHRRSQEFKEHGGAWTIAFDKWRRRLNKNLEKDGFQ